MKRQRARSRAAHATLALLVDLFLALLPLRLPELLHPVLFMLPLRSFATFCSNLSIL